MKRIYIPIHTRKTLGVSSSERVEMPKKRKEYKRHKKHRKHKEHKRKRGRARKR